MHYSKKDSLEAFLSELEKKAKSATLENLEIMGLGYFDANNLFYLKGRIAAEHEFVSKLRRKVHLIGSSCPILFVPMGLFFALDYYYVAFVFLVLFCGCFLFSIFGLFALAKYHKKDAWYIDKIDSIEKEIKARQLKDGLNC